MLIFENHYFQIVVFALINFYIWELNKTKNFFFENNGIEKLAALHREEYG